MIPGTEKYPIYRDRCCWR